MHFDFWTVVLLYLCGQADNIGGFLNFVAVAFGILTAGTLIAWGISWIDYDSRRNTQPGWSWVTVRRFFLSFMLCFLISGIISAIFPSSKTMITVLAGSAVVEAAKSQVAQDIAGNSVKLLDTYLQQLVDKQKQKDTPAPAATDKK